MKAVLEPLTLSDNIPAYRELTFQRFQYLLDDFNPDGLVIAIKAVDTERKPAGLGLAYYNPDDNAGEVLSVFIIPEHRGRGIGNALFEMTEQALISRNAPMAGVYYESGMEGTPVVEKILRKHDWDPPILKRLIGKSDRKIWDAPWISYPLPSDFTVFPWVRLTESERLMILYKQQAENWYTEELSPFLDEDMLEPLNSLGLRYQGEIAGWCITHRIAPDTIRYSRLFVRKDLQQTGCGMLLLAESVRRQQESAKAAGLENAYGLWLIEAYNEQMMTIAKRHFAPWAVDVREIRYSSKRLIKQ